MSQKRKRFRPFPRRNAHVSQWGRSSDWELETALEALNVGRDNKALLVTREERIIDVNQLTSRLLGQKSQDLIGQEISALLGRDKAPAHGLEPQRWETALMRGTGDLVDLEVIRQPLASRLPGIDVYAIRELADRRGFAEEQHRQQTTMFHRDEELRAQNLRFQMALTSLSVGVCVFDAKQRLVICNEPFRRIYELPVEHLRPGTTLRQILQQRIDKGLFPGTSAEAFIGERLAIVAAHKSVTATHCFPDGRIIEVGHHPIPGGGWVATHEDMTEQRRIETELEQSNRELEYQNHRMLQQEDTLKTQNAKLDAALANMFQGLAMFDAEQRVVIANTRFAEMYGLSPEQVKPGTTLRSIIEHRIASGQYVGTTVDEVLDRMRVRVARQDVSHMTSQLGDGRIIAVSIRPRSDGGWVTTHQDITEREKLNTRLEQQNALLKQREEELKCQNTLFGTAINNMAQGLCLFDRDQRVVLANCQFARIYGLTPAQVSPGTTLTAILKARAATGLYAHLDAEEFVRAGIESFNEKVSQIVRLADGRAISVVRLPMTDGGLISTHEDITEREKLHARLAQQHEQLDAALSNMMQGLAMFDAEHRIVVANDRYAEMYGLSPDQVRRGTTLRQIIEYRIAKGFCPGRNADDMVRATLARMTAGGSTQYVAELANGRCISVSAQTMAGGGTVTTHHDITEQRRSEAKIAHMAHHDTLTGLPNRALLNERLEQGIARGERGDIVAVHLLDLDHFKTVNDTLGHPAGDKLLRMVADRLLALVRETDTAARMGGDEFAVVQVGISEPADATTLALRIIETLGAVYQIDGHQVVIGASVGIAIAPHDGESPEQLMRNTDLALYRAKADGRGTFRFFEREMDAQMQERHALERDLRQALDAGQFELYYQPVFDLVSNSINGCETLIRWHHPERGLVPPDTFIPLAEEIGLIVPIGEWIIKQACTTAARWPQHLKIAVNLSSVQFRSPGLLQVIMGALAASGLAADRLELEITESVLLEDGEATLELLYKLRELGIRIAMDDFGTGYSSLSYLQSFPFDKIKIDRSFVKDIVESTGSLNIVRAISALAKGLGMAATAEGVETQEQLETIRSEGCTEMQGYLYSRPLPAAEVERFLISEWTGRGEPMAVAG
jgi:diguanylate cyclase (GGDEF)-like protein/PAS domain S-box-containing protein